MSRTTIKRVLSDTLEDLSGTDFQRFCHQLRDRREEPRIRRRAVEDKSFWQIADLLVSTFTELKALQVTLDILRQINCNEDAQRLESKTRACVDKGDPTFRKTSTGEVESKPSQEAQSYAASQWRFEAAPHGGPRVKKPQEVEAEAKARVLSEGGDPCNVRLLLSRFSIQFGKKYKEQTFKWLLENDMSYAAFVVAKHQKEREQTKCQDLMANKDSLTRYAIAYPEVLKEIRFHNGYDRSLQSGRKGNMLIGFGRYKSETLQDLYKSKDPEKISYVNFLRSMKSTYEPGSKMEVAVKYILQRDKWQPAADRKRLARENEDESSGGWATTASRPVQKNPKRSWRKTPY